MSAETKIQWCDATFNPWIGCTKVSPGCANCYAETLMDKRYGRVKWGKGNPRQRTSTANWKLPIKWNREAAATGQRRRVFCASLADWMDDEVPIKWLADLLALIRQTPNLDWLLLTKRPENWYRRVSLATDEMAESWIDCIDMPERGVIPENIWIGTSVENQKAADERIPNLLAIPAKVRFLSMEPLLGHVDLRWKASGVRLDAIYAENSIVPSATIGFEPRIHWVIVGGESGANARPLHIEWMRDIVNQCTVTHVPVFVKQLGQLYRYHEGSEMRTVHLESKKGDDMAEWPADLRTRQFPTP